MFSTLTSFELIDSCCVTIVQTQFTTANEPHLYYIMAEPTQNYDNDHDNNNNINMNNDDMKQQQCMDGGDEEKVKEEEKAATGTGEGGEEQQQPEAQLRTEEEKGLDFVVVTVEKDSVSSSKKDDNDGNDDHNKKKEIVLDSEGLLQHYDVILYGTGLIQSIVASALSRAGKSVLHCDINDTYGEYDAVYTYPYFIKKIIKQQQQQYQLQVQEEEIQQQKPIIKKENDDDKVVMDVVDKNNLQTTTTTSTDAMSTNTSTNRFYKNIPLHPHGTCHSLTFHTVSLPIPTWIDISKKSMNNSNNNNNNDINDNLVFPKPQQQQHGEVKISSSSPSFSLFSSSSDDDDNSTSATASLSATTTTTTTSITIGTAVVTPYGHAKVVDIPIPMKDLKKEGLCIITLELLVKKGSSLSSSSNTMMKKKEMDRTTTSSSSLPSRTLLFVSIPTKYIRMTAAPTSTTDSSTSTTVTDTTSANKIQYLFFIDPLYLYKSHQMMTVRHYMEHILFQQHVRSIAFDVSPTIFFAHGLAVDSMILSSVSDYIEFKSCESLFYVQQQQQQQNKQQQNNNKNTTKLQQQKSSSSSSSNNILISRVPCSKNDVFSSTLLNPMEKRRLMKFLQLSYDYATSEEIKKIEEKQKTKQQQQQQQQEQPHEQKEQTVDADAADAATGEDTNNNMNEVKGWNEKYLLQGRALSRPQNKNITNHDMNILLQCMNPPNQHNNNNNNNNNSTGNNMMTYEQYLREHHHLSGSLLQLVRYALTLENIPIIPTTTTTTTTDTIQSSSNNLLLQLSTKVGMERLCQHMMSLGKYGSTAFLIPLYGSGELPQAFCRSAAVYGATYLLRRSIRSIIIDTEAKNTKDTLVKPSKGNATVVRGIILDGYSPSDDNDHDNDANNDSTNINNTKEISCTHLVVPTQAITTMDTKTGIKKKKNHQYRVLRQISILNGKPSFPLDTKLHTNVTNSNNSQQQNQQIRYVVIIPPNTISSATTTTRTESVDGGAASTTTITTNTHPIQIMFLDETVNVVPNVVWNGGCTVVHLSTIMCTPSTNSTTNTNTTNTDNLQDEINILHNALQSILQQLEETSSTSNGTNKKNRGSSSSSHDGNEWDPMSQQETKVEEVFHATFSYELDTLDPDSQMNDNDVCNPNNNNHNMTTNTMERVHNLHLIRRTVPELACDHAFHEARRIYRTIMSSSSSSTGTNSDNETETTEFLHLSKELQEAMNEQFGTSNPNNKTNGGDDNDDREQRVLDSAVEMINSTT